MQMFHVYWFSKVSTFQSQESLIYVLFCAYIKLDNFFVAVASLLRWSRGEENSLLSHIFGRVAELNWMWKEAMDEFDNQVSKKNWLF